ncbi:LysR substrate-binding domain-containing protein [Undibacterium sp. TJN25]|uniref:LysR family transcriptional regulator n=1 Tax=Undibacterium sp. TJN25 TaxID=3413056 RepID=UPI003BF11957
MDLSELKIFQAVAATGSVSRAAEQLHRVQSNVTTRLQQLEEKIGVQLFVREKRRMTLTAQGRQLMEYADRLLALAEEAQAVVSGKTLLGTLRIGAMESTAAVRLPAMLAQFHLEFPGIEIELTTGTTRSLLDQVNACKIDCAFVAGPIDGDDYRTMKAFDEELLLVTPASLSRVGDLSLLREQTLIAFEAGCAYRSCVETWLLENQVRPRRVLELGSYHGMLACVAAGAGFAVVPKSVLDTAAASLALCSHAIGGKYRLRTTYLVARKDQNSSALNLFEKKLATLMKPARRAAPVKRHAKLES